MVSVAESVTDASLTTDPLPLVVASSVAAYSVLETTASPVNVKPSDVPCSTEAEDPLVVEWVAATCREALAEDPDAASSVALYEVFDTTASPVNCPTVVMLASTALAEVLSAAVRVLATARTRLAAEAVAALRMPLTVLVTVACAVEDAVRVF